MSLPRLALGFSGCGLLAGYHIGVWRCLLSRGRQVFNPHSTPLIGASGGALVAAVMSSGVTPDDALNSLNRILAAVRSAGSVGCLSCDLLGVVRPEFEQILPEDAHLRCSGQATVCLSDVSRLPWRRPKTCFVDRWESRSTLIDTVLQSSYIPFITSSVNPMGGGLVDGGLANNFPLHPEAARTVRISPFSGEIDICPASSQPQPRRVRLPAGISVDVSRHNASAALRAFVPSADMARLHVQGYDDACRWLRTAV